jgi:hypothetical protein
LNVAVTIPLLEVHEDDRAVDEVERGVGNRIEIVPRNLEEL